MKAFRISGRISGLLIAACLAAIPGLAQNRETRDKIDRIAVQMEETKTELTLLQRQVQSMQETFNKTTGELNTLIIQISDNISAIRRAQSSVSTNSNDTVTQISTMRERITATDQRIERLSEQFAQLRKLIEDIPKMPTFAQLTPGNAEQLFAAAYSDYSRGNYELALSEFRQYVETYPGSELTDNAQYWIGEIFYAQKKLAEAAEELEKVKNVNAKGDKVPTALYKRGLILFELGSKEAAVEQMLEVINDHSASSEAQLARQQLEQQAPEALAAPPDPKTRRKTTRRP
ncbi:MAG: tol-pal system protein YbgF [Blastocatellales bacterium]